MQKIKSLILFFLLMIGMGVCVYSQDINQDSLDLYDQLFGQDSLGNDDDLFDDSLFDDLFGDTTIENSDEVFDENELFEQLMNEETNKSDSTIDDNALEEQDLLDQLLNEEMNQADTTGTNSDVEEQDLFEQLFEEEAEKTDTSTGTDDDFFKDLFEEENVEADPVQDTTKLPEHTPEMDMDAEDEFMQLFDTIPETDGMQEDQLPADSPNVLKEENSISEFDSILENIESPDDGYDMDITYSEDEPSTGMYCMPSVGLHSGIISFFGDLGNANSKVSAMGRYCGGFGITGFKRFGSTYGVSINIIKGKMSEDHIRENEYFSFSSKVFSIDASFIYHLDNDVILPTSLPFSPFVSVGLGYLTFNPHTDLYDENNNRYYFWRGNIIKDQHFDFENPGEGNTLQRDYSYETPLDPDKAYGHGTLIVPLGIGIRMKLSNQIEAQIATSMYMTNTDYIDNKSYQNTNQGLFSGHNDSYLYSSVSFVYNICGKPGSSSKRFDAVDWLALETMDSDNDYITDFNDNCSDTPEGVTVDAQGCPLDDDFDGVPNYKDLESNTIVGSAVDTNGVRWSEQSDMDKHIRDSLIMAEFLFPNGDTVGIRKYREPDTSNILPEFREEAMPIPGRVLVDYSKGDGDEVVKAHPITAVDDAKHNKDRDSGNMYGSDDAIIINGVEFRFQIASLNNSKKVSYFKRKYNIPDKVLVNKYQGAYKYSVGRYATYDEASKYCDKYTNNTKVNCFVIAYKDGKRISLWQARKLTGVAENPDKKVILYRVQIASLINNTTAPYFKRKFNIKEKIYVDYFDGAYKYSIGKFTTFEEASKYCIEVKSKIGGVNSFVIAFVNGKVVKLWEVEKLEGMK